MNDVGARVLERLRKLDNVREFATVRPRDAATMIIIDRAASTPKVLLGRRHAGHKFMPDKFVFPGGRVEPLDRRMASASPIEPRVEARLMAAMARPSAAKARGLMLAAIRETFEETGILLGAKTRAPLRSPGGAWDAFVQEGVAPDLAAVHFIARAITPPGRGASTPASSPSMPAPSRHAATAPSAPTPSSPNWSGCRSVRPRASTCRRSRPRSWKSSPPASRPVSATTCRCRIIGW